MGSSVAASNTRQPFHGHGGQMRVRSHRGQQHHNPFHPYRRNLNHQSYSLHVAAICHLFACLLKTKQKLEARKKRFVAGLGASKCRVLDTCCVTDCSPTANSVMRVDALKKVTASDSIHFLNMGYDHLVKNIMQTLHTRRALPLGSTWWQGCIIGKDSGAPWDPPLLPATLATHFMATVDRWEL